MVGHSVSLFVHVLFLHWCLCGPPEINSQTIVSTGLVNKARHFQRLPDASMFGHQHLKDTHTLEDFDPSEASRCQWGRQTLMKENCTFFSSSTCSYRWVWRPANTRKSLLTSHARPVWRLNSQYNLSVMIRTRCENESKMIYSLSPILSEVTPCRDSSPSQLASIHRHVYP